MLDQFGTCPKCAADWDGGDIFTAFRPQEWCAAKTDEELREYIRTSYSPPYKFSRIIGIEFWDKYDGVWEYMCPDCEARFPRFEEAANGHRV